MKFNLINKCKDLKVRVTGEQTWENFYIRNDVENEYYKKVSFYKKSINNKIDILFNIWLCFSSMLIID
ncbi:hypothetical protein [Clostridium tertium]